MTGIFKFKINGAIIFSITKLICVPNFIFIYRESLIFGSLHSLVTLGPTIFLGIMAPNPLLTRRRFSRPFSSRFPKKRPGGVEGDSLVYTSQKKFGFNLTQSKNRLKVGADLIWRSEKSRKFSADLIWRFLRQN